MAQAEPSPTHANENGSPVDALATNGSPAQEGEQADGGAESIVTLTVILPHDSSKIQVQVSSQEQIHEVRQSLIDLPAAFQYTCFHLEHKGERLNDFISLFEVPGLLAEPEIKLVEDPYTEREARLHFVRIRELIGAAGDRCDITYGILPGTSLLGDQSADQAADDATSERSPVADYDFQSVPGLSLLVPKPESPPPKTIKSIALSAWHPPPCNLRQKGHLLYLVVTTNEGEQHQITAHIGGFYVNKSSNAKFDPSPKASPKGQHAHSLLNLLQQLSPSFSESLTQLHEVNSQKDPLAALQITHAIPAAPWAVPPPTAPQYAHAADPARSQEAFLIGGIENADTLRDWNEEFQTAREHPKESVQDRVFRERLLSKFFADYIDAATRGAMMVARGEIPPLNPTECIDAQIFVYNNVFFSFGADGVETFVAEGGDEAAKVATSKDVAGVRLVNQLDIDGLFTAATVVVDYLGKRVVGQSIVPGIFKQREPGEHQIDYGGVDSKDVVTADERFAAPFEKLARSLKIKKHPVWDKDGKRFDLEGSVETKGLLGTDGRKYVLDLYRVSPVDIAWLEESESEEPSTYPHRMTVLRSELVDLYYRAKMKEWVDAQLASRAKAKEEAEEETEGEKKGEEATDEKEESQPAKEQLDLSGFQFALNPDVFSGQVPQTEEEKAELEADEQQVRLVCQWLREHSIPTFLRDLVESDAGFPMDGSSLSRQLHKRGINIRYLGKIASQCTDPRLLCLKDVCVQDMITRAFKHVVAKYLRRLPFTLAPACIAHLLNCLLGSKVNAKPTADIDPSMKALYSDADLSFENVTPQSLKASIEEQVAHRFKYELPEGWVESAKPRQLLREISLALGLQIQARDYNFGNGEVTAAPADTAAPTPAANGSSAEGQQKKKKKKARDGSPASTPPASVAHTFSAEDILNIVPIVKHSAPRSSLAEEALEAGRISIMQNQRQLGQELLLESLSLHEQIYGIVHPEVGRAYNSLSMLYFQMDEKDVAVELAKKAVVVSERTVGVDSPETLLNYLNLGLFVHQAGDSRSALSYVRHALQLWKIIYGPDHPDSITTVNNAAVMLQHLKAYHESRLWFEESLRICEKVFGKQSINAATLLFQLAQALALDHDSKAAVNRMRESYNIFLAELGPDDKNTKEAESWLEQLTQNAVSIAKQAKDVQARRLRAGVRVATPRAALGHGPAASRQDASSTSTAAGAGSVVDSRSIDELLRYIEGSDAKVSSSKGRGRGNPKRRGTSKK
ncbi:related to translation initiation factor CluA [Cephalotrichum gorgonifer]|uniref:Clustered mitochondria protein homolog n=1 Tax=Cephalotrichum gorgonifer TaxID=2041049 RepID=A0AAE8SVQ3_9PEZI|nr:related to translation initiation factor CluA [Cephalotrichum gorgonifer]